MLALGQVAVATDFAIRIGDGLSIQNAIEITLPVGNQLIGRIFAI